MQAKLEIAIRDLLNSSGDPHVVARQLYKHITTGNPSKRESKAFLQFLIHGGYLNEALGVIQHWLEKKKSIHWRSFLELLRQSGFQPNEEFLNQLLVAISDEKNELAYFFPWSTLNTELKNLNEDFVERKIDQAKKTEELLFQKLDYFTNHRMHKEERRLLEELIHRYPEREDLIARKAENDKSWAFEYLAEKAEEYKESELWLKALNKTDAEVTIADNLVQYMQEKLAKSPNLSYNYSLCMYFMECFAHALTLLKTAPKNVSTDWFRLEVMYRCQRYLECLDEIISVENKYSDDPESTFAATYFRALVLDGLGQPQTALELMKSIIAVRPNYRSAHAHVLAWTGELKP